MQSFWTVIGLGFVTSMCGCGSGVDFDAPELEPPLRAATPTGLLANTRVAPNEVNLVVDRFYHPDGGILDFVVAV